MRTPPRRFAATLAVALLCASGGASSEQLVLDPAYRPGDTYQLFLGSTSQTRASSTGPSGATRDRELRLEYDARVEVLAVDEAGRAVHERHESVRLEAADAETVGLLLGPGATLEVRREGDAVRIFENGERIDRRAEKIVRGLLESRFEATSGPELFDPGREVAAGETWELEPGAVRRFLEERAIRSIRLGEPATARFELTPGPDGQVERVIHFEIPMDWFELRPMPPQTVASRSEGRLAGQIRLPASPQGQPVIYSSRLSVDMRGAAVPGAQIRSAPWALRGDWAFDERVVGTSQPVAAPDLAASSGSDAR